MAIAPGSHVDNDSILCEIVLHISWEPNQSYELTLTHTL